MKKENSIELSDVSKGFDIKYTTFYGGIARSGRKQVINGLSLDVRRGEVLGLIGRNGSGKSTLLKLISGILHPDSGRMEISGDVASILELGMGFDSESSGRENLRSKCALYGFTEREMDESMEDMIQFSELGEQIDHPLRTYSSGMVAKLAFSVLIHVRCDILIIDEILSVGDAGFNAKSRMVFDRMKKSGKTVVIASHNMASLEEMCDRVVWIDEGKVRESGDPASICHRFTVDSTDSPETVRNLAESGDLSSQYRLGTMYRDGISLEKDVSQARSWFLRASQMGHADSMLALGDMDLSSGDVDSARGWFSKASERGNSIGSMRLRMLDADELEMSGRLLQRIRASAESGNIRAMKLYGDVLYNGSVSPKDLQGALSWYERCAGHGNAGALFSLGLMYRDGLGIQKDSLKAIEYLTKASDLGNARARSELANIYRKGMGIERDMDKAIEWYTVAAERGDSNAMIQLGTIYRDGLGVDRDPQRSEFWFSMSAKQGRINAELALGDILKQGSSGTIRSECLEWYGDASDNGSIAGMFNLAMSLRDPSVSVVDIGKAVECLQSASAKGHPGACFELAGMLMRGEGIQQDLPRSLELMRHSADCGNGRAMFQTGLMYLHGIGTAPDPAMAREYLGRASEFGNVEARLILRGLTDDP